MGPMVVTMTAGELLPIWLAAKAGILRERVRNDLIDDDGRCFAVCLEDKYGMWYECPCGQVDHLALRPVERAGQTVVGLSVILTCFVNEQQWAIRVRSAAEVIYDEEGVYFALLGKAPKLVAEVVKQRGWSEATITFLHETHGIPREVAELVHLNRVLV